LLSFVLIAKEVSLNMISLLIFKFLLPATVTFLLYKTHVYTVAKNCAVSEFKKCNIPFCSVHDFYLYVKEPLSDAYSMVKIALSKGFLSAKYFFSSLKPTSLLIFAIA
jgi:hypothetical protein